MSDRFEYLDAFSRNLGWLTEWEQAALRHKTVAIAGMGGVGGNYLLTLTRLGLGGFRIADPDVFEQVNFNRQAGSSVSTLGRLKVDVLAEQAWDINPDLRIRQFSEGVTETNIDDFLAGADLFVDGFDFFELDMRRKVFARAYELGIPAVTAAPLGMGVAYLSVDPAGMSFERYFLFDGLPQEKQYVNFVLGLSPKRYQMGYLVDPTRADFERRMAPSTPMGVTLCAGIVGVEAVKLLLRPGETEVLPKVHHFDPYLGRWSSKRLIGGNAHPLQWLKRQIGYRQFAGFSELSKAPESYHPKTDVEAILDLARWAPSGDNSQPWRFELGESNVRVHVTVPPDNIYEFNGGQPTLTAAGCLLETIRIAASGFGYRTSWDYRGQSGHDHLIDVKFERHDDIQPDPLISYIPTRMTDRRAYSPRSLSDNDKAALEAAVGEGYRILWRESLAERWRMARLTARATDIRLRLREAYDIHNKVIDWHKKWSPDAIPAGALGLSRLTRRLMRPLMKDWRRVELANRYFGGTLMPRLELDLLPGTFCAAHFGLLAEAPARHVSDFLAAGQAIQRLWLTAESRGLSMQPNFAPICFASRPSGLSGSGRLARQKSVIEQKMADLGGGDIGHLVFFGRLGRRRRAPTMPRSTRLPTDVLIMSDVQSTERDVSQESDS